MAQVISTSVYQFNTTGNTLKGIVVMGIPMPALIVPTQSPDPRVYCYSKIIVQPFGPNPQEFYTAEQVSALITKANA